MKFLIVVIAVLVLSCDESRENDSLNKESRKEINMSPRLKKALSDNSKVFLEVLPNLKELNEEQNKQEMKKGGVLSKEDKAFLLQQINNPIKVNIDNHRISHRRNWGSLSLSDKVPGHSWSIWKGVGYPGLIIRLYHEKTPVYLKIKLPPKVK